MNKLFLLLLLACASEPKLKTERLILKESKKDRTHFSYNILKTIYPVCNLVKEAGKCISSYQPYNGYGTYSFMYADAGGGFFYHFKGKDFDYLVDVFVDFGQGPPEQASISVNQFVDGEMIKELPFTAMFAEGYPEVKKALKSQKAIFRLPQYGTKLKLYPSYEKDKVISFIWNKDKMQFKSIKSKFGKEDIAWLIANRFRDERSKEEIDRDVLEELKKREREQRVNPYKNILEKITR